MHTQIVLTSSQSKRLIAKGIVAWEPLKKCLRSGMLVVGKGTTNSYIVEELGVAPFDRMGYVHGRTAPAGAATDDIDASEPDVVLERGVRLKDITTIEAAARMSPGDIFLKGANAINYDAGQAAVLIGHPTGGTLGGALGTIISRRARLVHPVGLEKNVPGDLAVAARALAEEEPMGESYGLWLTHGELFTEIEAFETLYDVEAVPVGAGGILGAEGSVRIALFGTKGSLDRALADMAEIQKEPPYGAGASGQQGK